VPQVPVVSIVIIFLNADKFLADAIDSVLAQTFDKWELFLVDDGSTDRSTAMARSYADRYPAQVHYLEHEGHANKGMSASRNLGISHAKGEFIALLDADDIWFPDKLNTQVAILTTHPEAAMVAAPAMNWYADGAKSIQPMTLPQGVLAPGAWIPKILERDDNTAGPSSVLIRTRVLRDVGGFEASFKGPLMVFEDQVTWFKITLAAPVYFHPEPVILYRIHAESCCVSTPSELQLSGRIVLYARLADFIRNTNGPATKKGILLAMVRARVGELLLKTEPSHRQTASSLDTSGSVDRLRLGAAMSAVLLLGRLSKGKAIALFQKIFGVLSVAYHDGPVSSAKTLPRLILSATRSVVPRSLQN
jgi:glycosyltransferase involved in cell wall biosynthesis